MKNKRRAVDYKICAAYVSAAINLAINTKRLKNALPNYTIRSTNFSSFAKLHIHYQIYKLQMPKVQVK